MNESHLGSVLPIKKLPESCSSCGREAGATPVIPLRRGGPPPLVDLCGYCACNRVHLETWEAARSMVSLILDAAPSELRPSYVAHWEKSRSLAFEGRSAIDDLKPASTTVPDGWVRCFTIAFARAAEATAHVEAGEPLRAQSALMEAKYHLGMARGLVNGARISSELREQIARALDENVTKKTERARRISSTKWPRELLTDIVRALNDFGRESGGLSKRDEIINEAKKWDASGGRLWGRNASVAKRVGCAPSYVTKVLAQAATGTLPLKRRVR